MRKMTMKISNLDQQVDVFLYLDVRDVLRLNLDPFNENFLWPYHY